MKSIKIPNLSKVELNVPFVHFHKKEDNKEFCYIELFINVPLGTKCSHAKIEDIKESRTISVTFDLDHPKHINSEEFELIHIPQFKVKNVFPSEDTIISVNVHVNPNPGSIGPENDGRAVVRYKDVKL